MKGVQFYELFGGIALKNHAFLYKKSTLKDYKKNICYLSTYILIITYYFHSLYTKAVFYEKFTLYFS